MLVSVSDVRGYLGGVTIEQGMTSVMEDVIVRAQKMVETYLNRPVERVQVREVARSDGKGYLYLSATPVWKVISCGGTTATAPELLDPTPYTITPDPSLGDDPRIIDKVPTTLWKNSGTFRVDAGRIYTGYPCLDYIVEYIGGLDPNTIDDIKRVVVQMAAREWGYNYIYSAGNTGGNAETASYADARGMDMTDEEKKSIQRYRRRVAL